METLKTKPTHENNLGEAPVVGRHTSLVAEHRVESEANTLKQFSYQRQIVRNSEITIILKVIHKSS